MEGSVLSFLKAEWKVSETGSLVLNQNKLNLITLIGWTNICTEKPETGLSVFNIIVLLHEYWWILSRALYHIARACECNMIYCKGQYLYNNVVLAMTMPI